MDEDLRDASPEKREKSTASIQQEDLPLRYTLSPEEYKRAERALRFKIDLQIVPLCLLLYFLSFLDRTNIGQAKLSGLSEEVLNNNDHQYIIALAVLYPPYIILEIPSNLVLKRIGPKIWIPFLVVIWGIVSTLQGLVKSPGGLYVNRFFLGAAEAGILPGIAVYLTLFYKPRELQLRQALFFTGASLSGAFSGLLAAAISNMDGICGLRGWSWIFILEGIFTVVVGLLCVYLLPNTPKTCWGLTDLECRLAYERLESTSTRFQPREELAEKLKQTEQAFENDWTPTALPKAWTTKLWLRDTLRTFTDPMLLLLCVAGFCCALPVYSISYFSPTIVKSFLVNPTTVHAQLMTCPPFAVAFVYGVAIAFVSDYLQLRIITALPGMVLTVVGFAMAYASQHVRFFVTQSMTRYGGIFVLSSGAYSLPPVLFTWSTSQTRSNTVANNSAGHYKRATGLALLIVFTNCGGLTSTFLFDANHEAPRFSRGLITNLAISAFGAVVVVLVELGFLRERRLRVSGKRDNRVLDLHKETKWDEEHMRNYLYV